MAPAGFTLDANADRIVLTGPETDLTITIADVAADSAEAAVAVAWKISRPDFKRPVRLAAPRPSRHGWTDQKLIEYETSPDEKLVIHARVRRNKNVWNVTLLVGSEATVEKRLSALALVRDSLLPPGYTKESFAGKKPHALDAERLSRITNMLERARAAAGVPGFAVSFVQGDKVLFQGGFGERELGKGRKPDADTLFIIASNTKALTTLLLAELVDEKKLTWDMPVTSVYPSFKLGDAETTSKVHIEHLVCACTGLPRQDFEWLLEFKGATPKSEMALLGTFQPTSKFGETFQYSNLLASAGGFVAGSVLYPKKELGQAYDEAMSTKVFGPLGMKRTTFDFAKATRGNFASPHSEGFDGRPALASMDVNHAVYPLRPAGGAWSSVADLSHYVQMELARGKLPDGKRLVSEEALSARRKPYVAIGEHTTYGMGLEDETEYGVTVVHHGGSMIGYKSDMFWMPEFGIGGVILTNADNGGRFLRPFIRKTLEEMFDGNPEAEEDLAASLAAHKAALDQERTRRVLPPDPAVTAKLASRYVSSALGDVTVRSSGASRIFDFGEWKSVVASRKNDDGTMSMVTVDPGVEGFEFVVGERDKKRVLVLRDAQHEYVFTEAK